MELIFSVNHQTITRTDNYKPVSDTVDFLTARFNFISDEWGGLTKTALFKSANGNFEVILDNGVCTIPWEVLVCNTFDVSVFGVGETILITTGTVTVAQTVSGYIKGETPSDPTPSVYQRIIEMIADITKGGVVISADEGNIIELRKDGLYATAEGSGVAGKGIDTITQKTTTVSGGDNVITVTYTDGTTTTLHVYNGAKGEPFKYEDFTSAQLAALKGKDGYSPTAKVTKGGKVTTLTVTDQTGTTAKNIYDGEDGYSPTATVERVSGGAKITITDKNGTTTATVNDGTSAEPSESVSQEQIESAVNSYMAENPVSAEVGKGSITLAELDDNLQNSMRKITYAQVGTGKSNSYYNYGLLFLSTVIPAFTNAKLSFYDTENHTREIYLYEVKDTEYERIKTISTTSNALGMHELYINESVDVVVVFNNNEANGRIKYGVSSGLGLRKYHYADHAGVTDYTIIAKSDVTGVNGMGMCGTLEYFDYTSRRLEELAPRPTGFDYVVSPTGEGDFTTISDAVKAAIAGESIYVCAGKYEECVTVEKDITIVGESRDSVMIWNAIDKYDASPLRPQYGTFKNLTLYSKLKDGSTSISGNYCVHIDNFKTANNTEQRIIEFDNVKMICECAPPVGAGTTAKTTYRFVDCEFWSMNPNDTHGAFYSHKCENNSHDANTEIVELIGCRGYSYGTKAFELQLHNLVAVDNYFWCFTTDSNVGNSSVDNYSSQNTKNNVSAWNVGTIEGGTNGKDGKDGVTFTPSVSSAGVLSWTNNGGLANPAPFDLGAYIRQIIEENGGSTGGGTDTPGGDTDTDNPGGGSDDTPTTPDDSDNIVLLTNAKATANDEVLVSAQTFNVNNQTIVFDVTLDGTVATGDNDLLELVDSGNPNLILKGIYYYQSWSQSIKTSIKVSATSGFENVSEITSSVPKHVKAAFNANGLFINGSASKFNGYVNGGGINFENLLITRLATNNSINVLGNANCTFNSAYIVDKLMTTDEMVAETTI